MTKPVGGPPDQPNPFGLSSDQPKPTGDVASKIASQVLRSGEQSPSAPLSSRVSFGGAKTLEEEILRQWFASQPEDAKDEAQQILNILSSKDLEKPFEIEFLNFQRISNLPDVFRNCTNFRCKDSSLQSLPSLPACIGIHLFNLPFLGLIPEFLECREFSCGNCPLLQVILTLPECKTFSTYNCQRLRQICGLPTCLAVYCHICPSLEHLPEKLPSCLNLHCSLCSSLENLPEKLPLCLYLYCADCPSLKNLPEKLPLCLTLYCADCTSLKNLPEKLPSCLTLECLNCPKLKFLPEFSKIQHLDIIGCSKLLENIGYRVAKFNIVDGVIYLPVSLPQELKVLLTPPLPESASIDHLNSDLETFIKGLKESDLPRLKKEIQGEPDLASYKRKLSEWKESLFSRVQDKLAYLGTPKEGTEELKKFYEKIEYYLLHLDAFLSIEENRDALIERLQILQTQSACGARFIAELEQLFSMNCIGGETADLSNQFAQIASTEAKLAIERMFPRGDVHPINQAMFQLSDYLKGTYTRDQLSYDFDLKMLRTSFLCYNTSTNLVKTIQDNLKPSSPMEELFTQYLKENFSPELSKEQLDEVIRDVNDIWKATKERKIAAFETIDPIRKKPAEKRTAQEKVQMATPILTADEKACEFKGQLDLLLESKEQSFKDTNIKSGVESIKDEILYQEHYDQKANRWKPEIIAKALQKMGILATLEQLVPRRL